MTVKEITTQEELEHSFAIRKTVFVDEQQVDLEDEFDEFDEIGATCRHILVYHDGQPAGSGRIRWIDGVGKLERICILKQHRSLGLGKTIIEGLEKIAQDEQTKEVKLHGQTQAEGFYHKLGFKTTSDIFIEADIPHVVMTKKLS